MCIFILYEAEKNHEISKNELIIQKKEKLVSIGSFSVVNAEMIAWRYITIFIRNFIMLLD